MADNTAEIARVQTSIQEMLKRVPQKVLAGGVNTTRAYKEAVAFANKYVAARRPTLEKLQQAYQRLAAYQ